MMLTDAGPLVAILDDGEAHYHACVACLSQIRLPLLTTWPAFTEAMYLLSDPHRKRAQFALWDLVERGDVMLADQAAEQQLRMRQLMHRYRDVPMDLADASLVALAENLGLRDIFTLDRSDFRVYRIGARQTFRIWPDAESE